MVRTLPIRRLLAFLLLLATAVAARAQDSTALSIGHIAHIGKLTIACLEGPDRLARSYTTLQEGLKSGGAVIHERNSQTLHIDNIGSEDLFVQSGDLIKGGQQDRMVASDMILDPSTLTHDITVFCVEAGRSTKRGNEPLETFSASDRVAPIPHLRAMAAHELTAKLLVPRVGGLTAPDPQQLQMLQQLGLPQSPFQAADPAQQSIWHDVSELQSSLTNALHDSVTKNESPTSLQLALERASSTKPAQKLEESILSDDLSPHTVGYLYAIGGVIYGGDAYGSHALFAKMWPKLSKSIVAHVLSSESESGTLDTSDFSRYLDLAKSGPEAVDSSATDRAEIHVWETQRSYLFETRDKKAPGGWVHRAYVTK